MLNRWRRQQKLKKVRTGDGHTMKPYRSWQGLYRSMFSLDRPAENGKQNTYTVTLDFFDFSSPTGAYRANLYRDSTHHAYADLPAIFPVPGGGIEVAASLIGLKRIHYVPQNTGRAAAEMLTPHPHSLEGLRAALGRRHPALSAWLGRTVVVVLLLALVLGVPQTLESITEIPWVAEHVGTFISPLQLPTWFNTALLIGALAATVERALTIRHNWLIDGDFGDWDS